MTRAEIISLTRDLVREPSTNTNALLSNTGNLLRLINDAAEQVVLDLIPHMPEQFLKTKTVSLVADQAAYSLAATITAATLAFVDSSPDTITDSGEAFITSQFRSGMTVKISGAGETGNNGNFTLETVAAGTLTLDAADTLTTEAVGSSVTITELNPFYQIYKVERNVSGQSPREIDIIDPLEHQFVTTVGQTEAAPTSCWFEGDTLYFKKTPSTAVADYAKVYLIPGEAVTVPTNGPKIIPQPFHSCIASWAALLVANMLEQNPARFNYLYNKRMKSALQVWDLRYHQKPRFVRESVTDRVYTSDLERAFTDKGWE